MSPTSLGRVAAMLRFFGSVSNLSLLIIGDYYYSYSKMMKRKWKPDRDMAWVIGGCHKLCPTAMGLSMVTLFSLSMSIENRPLLWMVVRSQTYYPEHILAYESRKTRYALVVGSGSFWTD